MFKKSSIMRIFFGLPIGEDNATTLQNHIAETYPEAEQKVRWVRPGNHHVTVRFIGNIPQQKLSILLDSVKTHISELQRVSITIDKIAHFPNEKSKLIAAHVGVNPYLQQMYDAIELGVTLVGVTPERRPYRPHITLCRPRTHKAFHIEPIPLQDFKLNIKQLILYQSIAEEQGNRYVPLYKHELSGHEVL